MKEERSFSMHPTRDEHPDKLKISIGSERYSLIVKEVEKEKWKKGTLIFLEVSDKIKTKIRKALALSPQWKLRARKSLEK